MRLLLDTHVWIWSLLAPDRLTPAVARALKSKRNELWLSSVSVWELAMLVERGRIELDGNFADWMDRASERAPLNEAPLTHAIAVCSRDVRLSHRDPTDRLLAATAIALDLKLITADERLIEQAACGTLDAR